MAEKNINGITPTRNTLFTELKNVARFQRIPGFSTKKPKK